MTNEESQRLIREKMYERVTGAYKSSFATDEEESVVVKEENFITDATSDSNDDAVFYSTIFPGAGAYLSESGKDDIDISSVYHSRDDWDEEDQTHIPEYDKHYVWPQEILHTFMLSLVNNLKSLSVGDTGTGKTTFHKNMAAKLNQPFYGLGGRGDLESDAIIGRTDIEDGSTTFLLGEYPKATTKGYYVLLDEIWKVPPSINMVLQRSLERDGLIQIDEMKGTLVDKQFKPDPRCKILLADNVVGTGDGADKFAATQIQDSSTLNRVDLVFKFNYLPLDKEVEMLMNRYAFLPKGQATKMVSMANTIRQAASSGTIEVTMSPRNLMSWAEMALALKDYGQAFKYVMLERYADSNEQATIRGFWTTIYGDTL